jgi:hypothetical protein
VIRDGVWHSKPRRHRNGIGGQQSRTPTQLLQIRGKSLVSTLMQSIQLRHIQGLLQHTTTGSDQKQVIVD